MRTNTAAITRIKVEATSEIQYNQSIVLELTLLKKQKKIKKNIRLLNTAHRILENEVCFIHFLSFLSIYSYWPLFVIFVYYILFHLLSYFIRFSASWFKRVSSIPRMRKQSRNFAESLLNKRK